MSYGGSPLPPQGGGQQPNPYGGYQPQQPGQPYPAGGQYGAPPGQFPGNHQGGPGTHVYAPNYGPGGGLPPRKSQTNVALLLVVGIIGALVIGIVGWALFGRGGGTPGVPTVPQTPSAPSTPTSPTTPATPTPTPTTPAPTPTPSPTGGGEVVQLGEGISISLPDGWAVAETPEPGIAVVSNGLGYVTLQTFRVDAGLDAMTVMTSYSAQMQESYQNPTVEGPQSVDVGPDATGASLFIEGTRVGNSGSAEVYLGSTAAVRNADGVGTLSALSTLPSVWAFCLDDYSTMTQTMIDALT